MNFGSTTIDGLLLIQPELRGDARGFFARVYCEKVFQQAGLNTYWPQCNLTRTEKKGMLRGMHFQKHPKSEIKLIRCSAGVVVDVIVDLRPGSPTLGKSAVFELDSQAPQLLYVPAGCAHGFQCLTDNCELFYQMSEFYHPELASGVLWNDPSFGIAWPILPPTLSEKDTAWPLWTGEQN